MGVWGVRWGGDELSAHSSNCPNQTNARACKGQGGTGAGSANTHKASGRSPERRNRLGLWAGQKCHVVRVPRPPRDGLSWQSEIWTSGAAKHGGTCLEANLSTLWPKTALRVSARYLLDADWTGETWPCSRVNAERLGGRLWPLSGLIRMHRVSTACVLPAQHNLQSVCCRSGRARQTAAGEAHRSRRGRSCCVCFFRSSHHGRIHRSTIVSRPVSDRIAEHWANEMPSPHCADGISVRTGAFLEDSHCA